MTSDTLNISSKLSFSKSKLRISLKTMFRGYFFNKKKKAIQTANKNGGSSATKSQLKKTNPKVKENVNSSAQNELSIKFYDVKSNSTNKSNNDPSNFFVEKETYIRIVLILIDKLTRCFELLQMSFNPSIATVQQILNEIPSAATDVSFRKGKFEHISTLDGVRLSNDNLISYYFTPEDTKYHVVVAIPHGLSIKDFVNYIAVILKDRKTDDLVISKLKTPIENLDPKVTKDAEVKKTTDNVVLDGLKKDSEVAGTSNVTKVLQNNDVLVKNDVLVVKNDEDEQPEHLSEAEKENILSSQQKTKVKEDVDITEVVESEKDDFGAEIHDIEKKPNSYSNRAVYFYLFFFIFLCLSTRLVSKWNDFFECSEDNIFLPSVVATAEDKDLIGATRDLSPSAVSTAEDKDGATRDLSTNAVSTAEDNDAIGTTRDLSTNAVSTAEDKDVMGATRDLSNSEST